MGDFLLVIIELSFARCFRFVTIDAFDRQTDGQTESHQQYRAYASQSHDKKLSSAIWLKLRYTFDRRLLGGKIQRPSTIARVDQVHLMNMQKSSKRVQNRLGLSVG